MNTCMPILAERQDCSSRIGKFLPAPKRGRFHIERLEHRIAPESLLDLNLNVVIRDVNITIQDINVIVAGNVIQVGILSGPMSGTVNSIVIAS